MYSNDFRIIKLFAITRDVLFVSVLSIVAVMEMVGLVDRFSPIDCSVSNIAALLFLFFVPFVVTCYEFVGKLCKCKKLKNWLEPYSAF